MQFNFADAFPDDLEYDAYVRLLWAPVVYRYDCGPNAIVGFDCGAFLDTGTICEFPVLGI